MEHQLEDSHSYAKRHIRALEEENADLKQQLGEERAVRLVFQSLYQQYEKQLEAAENKIDELRDQLSQANANKRASSP